MHDTPGPADRSKNAAKLKPVPSNDTPAVAPLRVAVIDTDSGFVQVLTNRLDGLGWEHRVLS